MSLSIVEIEYLKLLEPELRQAIEDGEPNRAASFAKELARLRRKAKHDRVQAQTSPAGEGGHEAV